MSPTTPVWPTDLPLINLWHRNHSTRNLLDAPIYHRKMETVSLDTLQARDIRQRLIRLHPHIFAGIDTYREQITLIQGKARVQNQRQFLANIGLQHQPVGTRTGPLLGHALRFSYAHELPIAALPTVVVHGVEFLEQLYNSRATSLYASGDPPPYDSACFIDDYFAIDADARNLALRRALDLVPHNNSLLCLGNLTRFLARTASKPNDTWTQLPQEQLELATEITKNLVPQTPWETADACLISASPEQVSRQREFLLEVLNLTHRGSTYLNEIDKKHREYYGPSETVIRMAKRHKRHLDQGRFKSPLLRAFAVACVIWAGTNDIDNQQDRDEYVNFLVLEGGPYLDELLEKIREGTGSAAIKDKWAALAYHVVTKHDQSLARPSSTA